jgi:nucleoside-diphosphate-sugar epimerase
VGVKELQGLRCVITGGMGFIGSNLARTAASRGACVTVLDNLLKGCGGRREHIDGASGAITVIEGDARDGERLQTLVRDCDVVFALAGKVSHIESMQDPDEDLQHNLRTAVATLEAARRANPAARIVFASTRQVYGVPQYLPVDERHPVAPVDVNGINKLAAEEYHKLYAKIHGIRTVCLRLTNTYGPRQLIAHSRQGFTGWFVRLALEDRALTLYGDGTQRRDFLYVDDAVEALIRTALADAPAGSVFNVAGAEVVSLADVARKMCAISGRGHVELVPFPEERRAIDIGDFYADGSRLTELLDWRPAVQLDEGLRKTFAYYADRWRAYVDAC